MAAMRSTLLLIALASSPAWAAAARPAPAPPAPPTLTVTGFTLAEGNAGTTGATTGTFTIGLSAPTAKAVTVRYATRNGTAIADAGGTAGDYRAVGGTLRLPARVTSATVDVTIHADRLEEPDEVFYLVLSDAVNARLGAPQAAGEIVDDDGAAGPGAGPALSIEDAQVTEGDAGRRSMTFTVTLSAASSQPVTVDYATADGSATADQDYEARSGRLQFPVGATTRTVQVTALGDGTDEGDEDFVVQLAEPVNATLAQDTGRGIILDDDGLGATMLDLVGTPERRAQAGQVVALQVRVRGASGDPVAESPIQWSLDGSGELLDGGITRTDRGGVATQRVRLTESPGRVTVRATDPARGESVAFQVAVASPPG